VVAAGKLAVNLDTPSISPPSGLANTALFQGDAAGETWKEIKSGSPRSRPYEYLVRVIEKSKDHKHLINAARKFIKVAEEWHPDLAGGDIDILTLDKLGAHWVQVKPNCVGDRVTTIN
jgi:hypothetical protein